MKLKRREPGTRQHTTTYHIVCSLKLHTLSFQTLVWEEYLHPNISVVATTGVFSPPCVAAAQYMFRRAHVSLIPDIR